MKLSRFSLISHLESWFNNGPNISHIWIKYQEDLELICAIIGLDVALRAQSSFHMLRIGHFLGTVMGDRVAFVSKCAPTFGLSIKVFSGRSRGELPREVEKRAYCYLRIEVSLMSVRVYTVWP
jgi:hypothetical protein